MLVALDILLPNAHALTFSLEDVSGWPNQAHYDAAFAAAQSSIGRYNAFGDFNNIKSQVYIYYDPGIPTAQANFGGSIGFGGAYPAERVMMHEMAHFLGLPSGNWNTLIAGGWSGPRGAALVQQFDGEGARINGDGAHFWPYGLNYDNEGSEINKQRQVAMVYAMRADLGIGPTAHPSTATSVTMTADDPFGTSGFNYKDRWSDGYFAHQNAAYSTGDFTFRTPASPNGFTFAGDSLRVNNTNAINGGLLYKGVGISGVTTIDNLILDGGYVRHANGAGDLFQLDGGVTLIGNPTIDAAQGSIKILAPIGGAGSLNLKGASNHAITLSSNSNTYTGPTVVENVTLVLEGSTGFGLTTVRGGAALAGDGWVRGGLTAETGATLRVGAAGLPTGLASGQRLVDDFGAYPAGQIGATPNTTGDVWTGVFNGTANAVVVNNAGDNALSVRGINQSTNSWRGAATSLSGAYGKDFGLADNQTGTYFFRVRRNGAGAIDAVFGLSDLAASAAPGSDIDSPWNEHAVTLSIFGDTGDSMLRANSGGSGQLAVAPVSDGDWLNVWVTVDNSSKTYRVATSTGAADGTDSGSVYQFGRRTAGTVGNKPLVTFGLYEKLNVGAELDDLFFVEGLSLVNPLIQTPTLVGEKLTIEGDLTLNTGSKLSVDVAANAHDAVEVGGAAILDGVLEVALPPGYKPALNDTITVLTASYIANNLTLGGPDGHRFSLFGSTSTELILKAVSGLAGDYNNDGVVDAADYTVWRDHVGDPPGTLFNDNEDGSIGMAQYDAWRTNYGADLAALSVVVPAAAPEPRAALLLLAGLCGLARHRRTSR